MEKKDLNEMTLEQMQEETCRCALEICRLRSIIDKYQKRFNDLSYQIWKKQQNNETKQSNLPTDSKDN